MKRLFKRLTWTLLIPLALSACSSLTPGAPLEPQALILTVTSDADSGPGTLRRAIELADPESTITFADNVRTITLSSELVLGKNLTIKGPEGGVTISGNLVTRVFRIPSGGVATMNNLTITGGNAGSATGGGILVAGGQLQLINSTLSNNQAFAGGGLRSVGAGSQVAISGSTFDGNRTPNEGGGGINNDAGSVMTISDSTISNNSGRFAGGIANYNGAALTIDNSTITGNSCTDNLSGGGVENFNGGSSLTIRNSTITNNTCGGSSSGGGIFNNTTAPILSNTIVAGNSAARPDLSGAFSSGGYNLIGNTTGGSGFTDGVNGDKVGSSSAPINPLLAALADNGGPTKTVALLEGSPAIDAIPEGANGCGITISQDQRGVARPQGEGCDIGAFEAEPRPVLDTTPPVITPTVTGTLGDNGWYVSDVTVSWEVTDGESEISLKTGCDETVVSADTGGLTLTCSAESAGGAASESVTVKRDATSPSISVTGVEQGRSYVLGAVPQAACQTSDATSGVAVFASLSVAGGNADGTGSFTASCLGGHDHAGNTGSVSVSYTVTAPATPTPIEQLDALTAHVKSLKLHRTTQKALLTGLNTARLRLVRGRDEAAVRALNTFIKTVDAFRGRRVVGIRPTDATALKKGAREVIATIRAR